jgi:hypothetical protein
MSADEVEETILKLVRARISNGKEHSKEHRSPASWKS